MNKNKTRSVHILMERFWLVVAIISLIVVCYFFMTDGINRVTLQYLIFPAIAGLMYAFRSSFRKRMDKRDNQE